MASYSVTRIIDFCYGHRLLDYDGECRHLHGHNGRVEVCIDADDTDHRGMVVDFGEVKDRVKSWIDAHLDHRMILHKDDPLASVLAARGEAHYLLDRNPTAENIAAHIYEMTSSTDFRISEIRLWETVNSYAVYRPASTGLGDS